MVGTTLPVWLKQRAYLTPHRLALISEETSLTFAQLEQRASHLAGLLVQQGIKPGERIALLAGNTVSTVALIHAIGYVKGVLVPLNTRLSATELIWQINDAQASLLLFDEAYQDKVERLKEKIVCPIVAISQLIEKELNGAPFKPENPVDLDDLHTIIYTSGTTGRPKGAMLSYGNHFWSAVGSVLNLGLNQGDRWLCCVPLFHVSGLSILMRSVIYGMSVVLVERFDPVRVNQLITQHKVTHISVVSAMLQALIEHLESDQYPDHLRVILLGGGPVPEPLLKTCLKRSLPVYQSYGLTETASQIVTLAPEDVERKAGSAGKPLFPAQIAIMENGQKLSAGQAGEIVVKGPNVTKGYFNREEETARVLKDGWFYTGDIGYLDEEGYLYVLDRRSDLIISGGENVYPAEVESVLMAHPDVKGAGVIGQEDPKWGEVPVAFVVKQPQSLLSEEDLIHFSRARLASYKVPRVIYFVDHLPRNAANKLLRRELRSLLENPPKN